MSALRMLVGGLVGVCALAAGCAKAGDDPADPDAPDLERIDGPPGQIDGPPGEIDAPPHIDAGLPDAGLPDAAGCTVQQVQLFTNANLDLNPTGTMWSQFPFDPAYPLIAPPPTGLTAVTPPNVAWLGGFLSATDRMYQEVAIPPSATTLELRGQRLIGTEETGGVYDHVYLELYSTGDALLQTLVHWTNADMNASFMAFSSASPAVYAGQTIRVSFRSTTDDSLNTNFFFDSLRLFVTACQ